MKAARRRLTPETDRSRRFSSAPPKTRKDTANRIGFAVSFAALREPWSVPPVQTSFTCVTSCWMELFASPKSMAVRGW